MYATSHAHGFISIIEHVSVLLTSGKLLSELLFFQWYLPKFVYLPDYPDPCYDSCINHLFSFVVRWPFCLLRVWLCEPSLIRKSCGVVSKNKDWDWDCIFTGRRSEETSENAQKKQMQPMHYRARGPIGFLNVKKKVRSRLLFLFQ